MVLLLFINITNEDIQFTKVPPLTNQIKGVEISRRSNLKVDKKGEPGVKKSFH
jgi:hypothetical protein